MGAFSTPFFVNFFNFHLIFFIHDTPSAYYYNQITKIKIKMNIYLIIALFFQEVMLQGVFDILLAQKIASNLLFEKCSRFHISKIVWDGAEKP